MDHWRTYYAMKKRLGGEKLTKREEMLFQHYYPCPGCIGHANIIGKRRAEILFEHYVGKGNKTYVMYWRSHPAEYTEFLANSVNF